MPIARRLGERVLESCAARLKPSLVQAVKNLGISLENYSEVLASICQDASGSLEQNDACATSEHVVGFHFSHVNYHLICIEILREFVITVLVIFY